MDPQARAEELGREVVEKEQEQIMYTDGIMKSIAVLVPLKHK